MLTKIGVSCNGILKYKIVNRIYFTVIRYEVCMYAFVIN